MARDYSRAYWRHLAKSGEILGMMGLTEINLAYYHDLMAGARQAISEGRLDAYMAETQRNWAEGEAEGADKGSARWGRHTLSAGPAQFPIIRAMFDAPAPFHPGGSVLAKKKGRAAFTAPRPFFVLVSRFKSRLFCFIVPSVLAAV